MKTKVLIVDDNSDNLYLLKTLLKGQGWEVFEASNGKIALEIARKQVPDLIVSDILMPVMDGYALCRECKSDEKLKKIPFVFYTATYTEPKDEKFALDLGADRFIVKPGEPESLLEILTDLLEEKKTISPDEAKPLGEEMEFFRRHNEILFSKLEKKMLDLETLNQKLRTMEEQTRLSFENVSDVVFTLDMDLKIFSMSPSVEKVLGYKAQDFIGRNVSDLKSILTGQSLDQAINHISRILKGETTPPSIYEFIAKDQTIRVGEVSGSPIIRDGNISGIVAVARDITESRKAQEALRNSELRVQSISNNLPDAMIYQIIAKDDSSRQITYLSDSVRKMYGISPEEGIADPSLIYGRVHEDDIASLMKAEEEALKTLSTFRMEVRVREPSGGIRWSEFTSSPTLMKDGSTCWDGIELVITERKRVEEELRRREEQFSLIVNSFPGRIARIDRDFRYQFINNQFENFHGMKSDQVLGHTVAEVFGEDIFQRLRPVMQKALDGEMVSTDTRFETSKGKTIYGLNNYIPDRGPDGTIRGIFGVIFDITKIKEAEKNLKNSEENFRNSMDQSILGVRIVSDDGTTLYANQALLNLYGLDSIEELKNTPVTKCYTKESLAENRIRREQRKRGESGPLNYVISIIAKDGKLRHLDVFRKEVIWDGVKRFQVLYNDITERRRAEEALRERDILFNKLSLNVPGMIYQFMRRPDGSFCVPFSSIAIMDIFGCSPEDVRNDFSPILRVLLPEDLDKLSKSIELSAEQMTTWQCEYRVQLPGQPVKWLFGQSTPEKFDDGSIIWHGFNTDITERKRVQEALQESEEKFRLISDQSLMAIVLIQGGLPKYFNQAYCDIIGYTFDDIMKWQPNEFKKTLHPDDYAFVMDQAEKKQSGHSDVVTHYQFRGLTKKQEMKWLDLYSKTVMYKGESADLVSFVDITERKRAEEALRENEELYRTIFDNTGTSMILIEEDMTISMANDEFLRNTGYSSDEINGHMKWTEIIHPDDLRRMIEQHRLRREIEGNALPSYEFRFITKTGDIRDTFLTIKLVPGTKKSIASLIDITERKKEQGELQQTLDRLSKAMNTTIHLLAGAVEARDPYTAGHQTRSADLARAIAAEMEMPREKIDGIGMAGSIHDIGKLSVPAEILTKSSKLTRVEFALVKEHAVKGYEMLKDVESSWPLAEMVYQHHERMDGSGYPRNLKGEEIIMEARILAVADVVEAMSSHRPYRPALGVEAALEEIEKNRGILYDDTVTEACLRLFREKGYHLPDITL